MVRSADIRKAFACVVYVVLYVWTSIAHADVLTYEGILQQAAQQSYDMRIAGIDVNISETGILEARSQYYPQIRARMNSEYQNDLTGGSAAVTTVGDTVLPAGTRYQSSVNFTLTHTLYNFGIRHRRVDIAKADMRAKQLTQNQAFRDLKLRILEHYTSALRTYISLASNQELLPLRRSIYEMKERLYDAGKISKIEVAEEAIELAKVVSENKELVGQLEEDLSELSFYTQVPYTAENTIVTHFDNTLQFAEIPMDLAKTPEARIYNLEIKKKEKELEIKKRERLPQLTTYTYYNLFGFDPDRLASAVGNLQNRSLSVGVALNMPVFDGFKNRAQIKKTKLEIQKLQLEKEKRLAELQRDYRKAQALALSYIGLEEEQGKAVATGQEKLKMGERLSQQQLVDKTTVLKQRIELIHQNLELQNAAIQKNAALKKLQIMLEG